MDTKSKAAKNIAPTKVDLETLEYTSKNHYLEQAILGGHSITEAGEFWDKHLKGARGASFFGMFLEALRNGGFENDKEVEEFIRVHVEKTGKKTMSSKGFYTSINTLVNDIKADLTK